MRKLLLEENLKIRGRKDSKVSRTGALSHCSFASWVVPPFLFLTMSCFLTHDVMQLEVVALLFSDVLLMTKVHKKGERLKVVRPPLALDRTNCIPLKDSSE